MMTPAIPQYRKRRVPAKKARFGPPPPDTLTLVAATYFSDPEPARLRLQFDRAIDVAAMDGHAIVVQDGDDLARRFFASGPVVMLNPATVEINLVSAGGWGDEGVFLVASPSNGIVAVGDEAAWSGVSELALPFP